MPNNKQKIAALEVENWNLKPFDLGWGDQCNACLTAERRHRELVAAARHIDSDRHRGPSDWDRECQESRRLNR